MIRYEQYLSRPQYLLNFCISLKNRYLYAPIPKAGHTTIKLALSKLEIRGLPIDASKIDVHSHVSTPFVRPYQVSESLLDEILLGANYFKFVFVRNPYVRALSCYLDKIEREGRQERKIITDILGKESSAKVSFTEFLEAVKSQPIPTMDLHWKPQTAICLFDQIEYHFIGRLESLASDLSAVFEKIVGLASSAPKEISNVRHHATNASDLVSSQITENTINRELIEDIYSADFKAFDYPKSPEALGALQSRSSTLVSLPVKAKAAGVTWIGTNEFAVGEVSLVFSLKPLSRPCLKKNRAFIEEYEKIRRGGEYRKIIELGVLWGGSAIFLNELFSPEVLLMLDIKDQTQDFFREYRTSPRGHAIRTKFGISQDNKAAVRSAIVDAFGEDRVDLVIDDASHLYEPSVASFEVLFPRLRTGGIYVIEDWGWAHWPGLWQSENAPWQQRSALSNFIFELSMICASKPEVVANFQVTKSVVLIERGPAPLGEDFLVKNQYFTRGRNFIPSM